MLEKAPGGKFDEFLDPKFMTALKAKVDLEKCADRDTAIVQAYILTATTDENQCVLHFGCYVGNLELVSFIIEKSSQMGLL